MDSRHAVTRRYSSAASAPGRAALHGLGRAFSSRFLLSPSSHTRANPERSRLFSGGDAATYHVVREGETLQKIAQSYGIGIQELRDLNWKLLYNRRIRALRSGVKRFPKADFPDTEYQIQVSRESETLSSEGQYSPINHHGLWRMAHPFPIYAASILVFAAIFTYGTTKLVWFKDFFHSLIQKLQSVQWTKLAYKSAAIASNSPKLDHVRERAPSSQVAAPPVSPKLEVTKKDPVAIKSLSLEQAQTSKPTVASAEVLSTNRGAKSHKQNQAGLMTASSMSLKTTAELVNHLSRNAVSSEQKIEKVAAKNSEQTSKVQQPEYKNNIRERNAEANKGFDEMHSSKTGNGTVKSSKFWDKFLPNDAGKLREINGQAPSSSKDSVKSHSDHRKEVNNKVDVTSQGLANGISSVSQVKSNLLDTVYNTARGLDGTLEQRGNIEELLTALEGSGSNTMPTDALQVLNGHWKLIYTTNTQMLMLLNALRRLPIITIGDVYQIIDGQKLTAQNKIDISVPFLMSLNALSGFEIRTPRQFKVRFQKIGLDTYIQTPQLFAGLDIPDSMTILGTTIDLKPLRPFVQPISDGLEAAQSLLHKVVSPEVSLANNDQNSFWLLTTYLDETLRISRDAYGKVFVLIKDMSIPMHGFNEDKTHRKMEASAL